MNKTEHLPSEKALRERASPIRSKRVRVAAESLVNLSSKRILMLSIKETQVPRTLRKRVEEVQLFNHLLKNKTMKLPIL